MNKYHQGKIYKLSSVTGNNVYYGSTIRSLKVRLTSHRYGYKKYNNNNSKYKYVTSFDVIKYDDHIIELVELYPCDTKKELTLRESYYIKNNICVNKLIPCRTQKQYRIDNEDKIREYKKKYREINKTELKLKYDEYRKTDEYKEKRKQYYNVNNDKYKLKWKQYRDNNKEKIKTRNAEYRQKNTVKCICGSHVYIHHVKRHELSKKHKKYILEQVKKD